MAEWLKAHAWKACVRETVPWVRIPLSPPLHCSPLYPIVRIDNKTTSSAISAASSAMLPVVTAQTVAFDRGFGGRISRGGTHGRQAQAVRRRTRNSARRRPLPHRRGRHVEELELPVLEGRQTALAWPRLAHGRCALMPIVGSMIAQGRAPDYAKTTAGRAGGRLRRVGFRIDEKPRRWSTTPTTP